MADVGSILGKLGGTFTEGGVGQQLLIWSVLGQLIGAALGPPVADITQAVNSLDPVLPLTPEQLAVAEIRGIIAAGSGADEAAKSGIGTGRYAELMALAASPPNLGLIIAAWQRQLAPSPAGDSIAVDLDTVLADLGIEEKYWPLVKDQAILLPSAAEVLNAWLEGQIEEDEAVARLTQTGLDPTWIQTAYNANGQAPTPTQALDLLNRGIIPESGTGPASISYEQAFLEGPWRNKWLAPFEALRYYLSPPRTVTAMLREGSITQARALQLFQQNGLDAQTTAEYIAAASSSTTSSQKELSQAQITAAYEAGLITKAEAQADLVKLRYSAADATTILALADYKTAAAQTKSAVTRLQTLYLDGKNDAAVTRAALSKLGLADELVTSLIGTWDLEQATVTKTLTAAQLADAVFYTIMTAPTALTRIQALGYDEQDAQIILYNRLHGAPTGWTPL